MFYRIKNERIYDYADYEYSEDCLYSEICTMKSFQENPDIYTLVNGKLAYVENYQTVIIQKRQEQFEQEFFRTSLGWIRRQVTMKDGTKKDFLADLLLPIKAGMEMGQDVKIITYNTPDYTREPSIGYMQTLQEIKSATPVFIQECLFQTVLDFGGIGVNIETITEENAEADTENMNAEGGNNGV